MYAFKIILIIFASLYLLLLCFFSVYTKRFWLSLVLSVISGLFLLAVINITSKYSGVYIPVNEYSVGASGLLGIPGVIGLLIINIIFL